MKATPFLLFTAAPHRRTTRPTPSTTTPQMHEHHPCLYICLKKKWNVQPIRPQYFTKPALPSTTTEQTLAKTTQAHCTPLHTHHSTATAETCTHQHVPDVPLPRHWLVCINRCRILLTWAKRCWSQSHASLQPQM